ncbi:MAG TPA: phospholipid carrier-dependent glycosyltransferase, partial [Verrucomicrobiae bacterium]|nr:phospholipid carrier-dependent glycosyltransferase [Verrucomicrobiae bacterium]
MTSRRAHALAVAALLAVFAVSGLISLRGDSATFDETAHLAAGYTALEARDFRLNPEHPPLSKLWCAIPLLFDPGVAADYRSTAWTGTADPPGAPYRTGADQWTFGFDLMNGPRDASPRRDPARVLVPARSMMILLGLALGLVVYAWSRELWGPAAGLLSLFIFALSPALLAHARLVTTDLPAALGFTATLGCLWRFMRRPGPGRGLLFAAALAMSQLAKFSLLILWPITLCMTLAWILAPAISGAARRARARQGTALLAAALVLAPVAIWAGYAFRFTAAADPAYRLDWKDAANGLPRPPGLVGALADRRLLPEAYLYGLHSFLGTTEKRVGYLNGSVSVDGWWSYFPEAFLLKTPPAFLLLLGALGA